MNVVLTGGGTAGHINPALALAEELVKRGTKVFFAGTPQGIEARLVPAAGIPFQPFEASGFNRSKPLTLVKGVTTIHKSSRLAEKWLREINADVVVGFGGYVSIPVAQAAEKLGIPVVVHEQNSYMGLANRELSKKAAATCLTYEVAAKGTKANNPIVTGNPVRRSVVESTRQEGREMLGIPEDAIMLLVFGGSLGARHINQAICSMKETLLAHEDLYVVHITGPKELDSVKEALALTPEQEKRWNVMGYQDRMGETLAAADAVVSRAGATSLAEISALGIPALLVPFPYATDDHQTTNARSYVEAGCAYSIADDKVETEEFKKLVLSLIEEESVRSDMNAAAKNLETANAAAKLADVVMGVYKERE